MQGFTTVDTVVMAAYLIGIVCLGSLLGRGQKNVGDFFLGGRAFGWLPIALSVIATDLSAISYMGCPAVAFQRDLRYAVIIFLVPLSVLIALPLTIKTFYRMGVFTVYEYLEKRYGVALRFLASILFILIRVGWLSTAVYVPSLALSVVTGLPVVPCILVTGLFATFYATIGGIKAVIWCDVVQFFVLVGGALLALGFVLYDFGGDAGSIWSIAAAEGKTRLFDFQLSLTEEFTFWSLIVGGLVLYINSQGFDQVVVQRYLSAKSLGAVVRSAVAQSLIVIPVILIIYMVGTALVAYYAKHPDMMASLMALDPEDAGKSMDRVLPHFITYGMPVGITGIVIAGIMAATMSSVDSGINSLATVAVVDYYKRFFHSERKDERHYLRASRIATVCFGLTATILAQFVGQLGTIIEIMGKISSIFVGPLAAMFFLGALTRRANGAGVFAGTVIGLGFGWWLANESGIFWSWWSPMGLAVSAGSGYLFSLLWTAYAGAPSRGMPDLDTVEPSEEG